MWKHVGTLKLLLKEKTKPIQLAASLSSMLNTIGYFKPIVEWKRTNFEETNSFTLWNVNHSMIKTKS